MERIEQELAIIKEKKLLRKINSITKREACFIEITGKKYIDFSSNDYLGLALHEKIIFNSQKILKIYGTGSSGSRLLGGSFDIHEQLEEKIAKFKGKESALVFNSGYQANIGLIQTLCDVGDAIFLDKLCHASIVDGIRLSGVKFFRFKHNDIRDLERLLTRERKNFKNALVITESVFSMDGDIAPLKEICAFKKKYDFKILVDEAHATGIFGKNGSGMVEAFGLTREIDCVMGTFSKALGSFGAYLACSQIVKDYLVNKCRSFIFSTALPPAVIAANIASIDVIKQEPDRRKKLLENVKFVRNLLTENGFKLLGETQIIPILTKDVEKTVAMSDELKSLGYWIQPIRYPTVALKEARLRLSVTTNHSPKILKKLVHDLKIVSQKDV